MFDTTANRYLRASLSSAGSTSGYSCISGNNSKYRSIRSGVPTTMPKFSNASPSESRPISRYLRYGSR